MGSLLFIREQQVMFLCYRFEAQAMFLLQERNLERLSSHKLWTDTRLYIQGQIFFCISFPAALSRLLAQAHVLEQSKVEKKERKEVWPLSEASSFSEAHFPIWSLAIQPPA